MSNNKDYYKILGISKDATEKEIKSAYRSLSIKWHPDKNQDNTEEATEKFKQISEAYNVLSDPEKKKIYDEHGHDGLKSMDEGGGFGGHGVDVAEIFRQMFGKSHKSKSNVPDVEIPLECSLDELYSGFKKEVKFDRYDFCGKCSGKGTKDGVDGDCETCQGNGVVTKMSPMGFMQSTCHSCRGSGLSPKVDKCKKCMGKRFVKEKASVKVTIPAGAYHKYYVVIENEGNAIPDDEIDSDGKTRSNVVVIVDENQHDEFQRKVLIRGLDRVNIADLMININVTLADSLIGFEKNITHLDGHKIKLAVDHPIRHGDILIMKGEGMPVLNEGKKKTDKAERGDLFIQIAIDMPQKIPTDVKKAVWSSINGDKPMPKISASKHTVVSFDDYSNEASKEKERNDMRDKYRSRGRKNSDSDSDDEGRVKCAQQ